MADPRPPFNTFLSELRRRRVFRVALAYAAAAWVLLEVVDTAAPLLRLPDWTPTLVLVLLLVGFPVALILAWAYQVTPEGGAGAPTPRARGGAAVWVGAIVLLALIGVGAYAYLGDGGGAADGIRITSVAVLPFADLSAAGDQQYFADGIAEELLDALAQLEGLRVAARTSSFRFRGADIDVRDVGRELNVGAVLEGSIRRADDRVRITAQLIDAADGYHLWSDSYDRRIEDIFAIQDEIARSIVDTLQIELLGGESGDVVEGGTEDVRAHDLYLLGRHYLNRRELDEARTYFERAVERDPEYARALAGLAQVHYLLPIYTDAPAAEHGPEGKRTAHRALALDPSLPEAYAALGAIYYQVDRDFGAAERELRRAIELNPDYASAHQWLGEALVLTGRPEEGLEALRRAQAADPLSPIVHTTRGEALYVLGRVEETIAQLERTVDRFPEFALARIHLARALLHDGRYAESRRQFARGAAQWFPEEEAETMANAHAAVVAAARDPTRRDSAVARVARLGEGGLALPLTAMFHARLGDADGALRVLDRMYRIGHPTMPWMIGPDFERIRSDPRYRAWLEKVGMAPAGAEGSRSETP